MMPDLCGIGQQVGEQMSNQVYGGRTHMTPWSKLKVDSEEM